MNPTQNLFACPTRRLLLPALFAIGLASISPAAPNVASYPLGANIVPPAEGGGVVFRLWAPNALSLNTVGQFNGWNTTAGAMTKDPATGIWSTWISNASLGQEYKFYMNRPTYGTAYKIDPRSRRNQGTTGNSIISGNGSSYPWQATGWQTPDKDRLFIYELHIGTFSGNGDGAPVYPARYRDVVDYHLDDLKALGVNMVKLMPIHEFPLTSWGYNPVHFFAPESDYGTPDDLRYMVDKLHQNGIGVILDVVYNHTSTTDNNLWDFDGPANIYFFGNNCQGETQWGNTRPKYADENVFNFILDNVHYWMSEFRLDGLRLDATTAMRGYCNEEGEGWLLMGEITSTARAVNPRAILIAEELPNNALVTTPRNSGGAGYDAQWCDLFGDTFRAELAKLNTAGSPDMNAIANAIANTGWGGSNLEAVKFVENHDEVGNGDRLVVVIDEANPASARARNLSKVSSALTILSPGMPMFFQGQEFLEDKRFGDGSADRVWWGFLNINGGVRDMLGELGTLRTTRGSLRAASGCQIIHVNDGADVVAFQRYDQGGDVTFVIANFGTTNFTSYTVGVPQAGAWHELVNSDATIYQGSGITNGSVTASTPGQDGMPAKIAIKLAPQSIAVFSQTPLPAEASSLWVIR